MSKIRDIEAVPLAFAPAVPYGSARGLAHIRGGSLILLHTEDGVEGIGEAWGPPGVTSACLDVIKPFYIGQSVFAQQGAAQRVLAALYHAGTQNQFIALMGGIDIAAHDAIGKMLNLSVADLIGGRLREQIPVYASGGYFTAGDDQDRALATQLEACTGKGFGAFKIKIGREPREDGRRVHLARRIVGPDPLLTVDTNGNYTEDSVLDSMRLTASHDIHWYDPSQSLNGMQAIEQKYHDLAPDNVQFIVTFTSWRLQNFGAFYVPMANDVTGIGYENEGPEIFDSTGPSPLEGQLRNVRDQHVLVEAAKLIEENAAPELIAVSVLHRRRDDVAGRLLTHGTEQGFVQTAEHVVVRRDDPQQLR